jgi:mono/diheme cytochrome c family protein
MKSIMWLFFKVGMMLVGIVMLSITFFNVTNLSIAKASPNGEQLFKVNCASCHAAGGNIVDQTKPVRGSKKLVSKVVFKDLLSKPTGAMPPFPKIVADDSSLSALYEYCKSLK